MDVFGAVFLSLGWLMLHLANGALDYISQGQGLQLQGDFILAGLFPLHYEPGSTSSLPDLVDCNR